MRPRITYGVLALSGAALLSGVSTLGVSRSSPSHGSGARLQRTPASLALRRSIPTPPTTRGHRGVGGDAARRPSPPRHKKSDWHLAVPIHNTGRLPAVVSLPGRRLENLFGVGTFAAQRSLSVTGPLSRRAELIGAGWVREEFTASRLHSGPDAPYWWGPYDTTVDTELASGLRILGLLDYSNTWGLADHGTMRHGNIARLSADFARYAYQVARHFRGRISYWEVWNEPDLSVYWHPKPRPDDYARLLSAAYRAIKQANPSARVVFGGTSGVDLDFIRAVAAHTNSFDVIAVHPYRKAPEDHLLGQIRALEALGKPVWFSEIGWPSGAGCGDCPSGIDQARYLVRFYALAAAAGVQRVFWYDFRDDERSVSPQELHFGLLHRDLVGKPASSAYAYLSHLLGGATFLSADRLGSDGLYALRFQRQNGPLLMVWNTGSTTREVTLPWPGTTAIAVGIEGAVRRTVPVVAGTVTWQANPDGDPIYLLESPPLYHPPVFSRLLPPAPAAVKPIKYRPPLRHSVARKPRVMRSVAASTSSLHRRAAPHRRLIASPVRTMAPRSRTVSRRPPTPSPPTPAPTSAPTFAHPGEESTQLPDVTATPPEVVTATPTTPPSSVSPSPVTTATPTPDVSATPNPDVSATLSPDVASPPAAVTLQPATDAAPSAAPAQAVASPVP